MTNSEQKDTSGNSLGIWREISSLLRLENGLKKTALTQNFLPNFIKGLKSTKLQVTKTKAKKKKR